MKCGRGEVKQELQSVDNQRQKSKQSTVISRRLENSDTLVFQYCNTQSWELPGTEVNIVRHALPYRDDLHWPLLQVQSHLFPANLTKVYLINVQTEMEKRYV